MYWCVLLSSAHSVARLELLMTCMRDVYVALIVRMRNSAVSASCVASTAIHSQCILTKACGMETVPLTTESALPRRVVPWRTLVT